MGFRKDSWATIWDVEEGKGNTMKVRLSTSRKNKETGEYEQDFSGFCMFIGNAKSKSEKLKARDRIKLGDVDVTTWYNKEKGTEYVTYKVFDFEFSDNSNVKSNNDTEKHNNSPFEIQDNNEGESVEEDGLPF